MITIIIKGDLYPPISQLQDLWGDKASFVLKPVPRFFTTLLFQDFLDSQSAKHNPGLCSLGL